MGYQDLFITIGRILISVVFLWNCVELIVNWKKMLSVYNSKGIPSPQLALPAVVCLRLIGALSVLVNMHPHIGALLMLVASAPTPVFFHPFWKASGNERMEMKRRFMSDMIILGAFFLLMGL
jgi:uncharacterized membrane protein YphA (DoxX/SURF4 family)